MPEKEVRKNVLLDESSGKVRKWNIGKNATISDSGHALANTLIERLDKNGD